jgi:hypothetical protein
MIFFLYRITEALLKADEFFLIPGKDGYCVYYDER